MNNFGNPQFIAQQLQQFRSNPLGFMAQKGLNIPQQFANDPAGAVQYLMNDGKLTQEQYGIASNIAQNFNNNGMTGR